MKDIKKESRESERKAKRKYQSEKRKKIACDVSIERYEEIKKHAENKGHNSINSYVINLINADMEK